VEFRSFAAVAKTAVGTNNSGHLDVAKDRRRLVRKSDKRAYVNLDLSIGTEFQDVRHQTG
jgi:hypothetical protein